MNTNVWVTTSGSVVPVVAYRGLVRTMALTLNQGIVLTDSEPQSLEVVVAPSATDYPINPSTAFLSVARTPTPEREVDLCEGEECFDITNPQNAWRYQDGVLVRTQENGSTISIGDVSAQLSNARECFSTQVKANGGQCENYVTSCLMDNDTNNLESCFNYIAMSGNFWKVTRDEIRNMHPDYAFQTLRRFGFEKESVHDETAGRTLTKVENVEAWLRRQTEAKFDTDGSNKLRILKNNTKLLTYLQHTVNWVNCNPALLNKDYSSETQESTGVFTPSPYLQKMGIEVKKVSRGSVADGTRLLSSAKMRASLPVEVRTPMRVASSPFGVLGMIPRGTVSANPSLVTMMGGSNTLSSELDTYFSSATRTSSDLLGEVAKGLLQQLTDNGDSLEQSDVTNLFKRIDNMRALEKEVVKTIKTLDQAQRLRHVLGEKGKNLFTEQDLERLINHHKKVESKLSKREVDMATILLGLRKMCDDSDRRCGKTPL